MRYTTNSELSSEPRYCRSSGLLFQISSKRGMVQNRAVQGNSAGRQEEERAEGAVTLREGRSSQERGLRRRGGNAGSRASPASACALGQSATLLGFCPLSLGARSCGSAGG